MADSPEGFVLLLTGIFSIVSIIACLYVFIGIFRLRKKMNISLRMIWISNLASFLLAILLIWEVYHDEPIYMTEDYNKSVIPGRCIEFIVIFSTIWSLNMAIFLYKIATRKTEKFNKKRYFWVSLAVVLIIGIAEQPLYLVLNDSLHGIIYLILVIGVLVLTLILNWRSIRLIRSFIQIKSSGLHYYSLGQLATVGAADLMGIIAHYHYTASISDIVGIMTYMLLAISGIINAVLFFHLKRNGIIKGNKYKYDANDHDYIKALGIGNERGNLNSTALSTIRLLDT